MWYTISIFYIVTTIILICVCIFLLKTTFDYFDEMDDIEQRQDELYDLCKRNEQMIDIEQKDVEYLNAKIDNIESSIDMLQSLTIR